MTRARSTGLRRIALLLAAGACMVVLGFLHTHGHDGQEQLDGSHYCFSCSIASSVDVEAEQPLPQVEVAPLTPVWGAPLADPGSEPLIVFSARAPPRPLS